MKVKIEFTVDVHQENIQIYLDEVGFDETVREYVKSFFSTLEPLLDDQMQNAIGMPAIKSYLNS